MTNIKKKINNKWQTVATNNINNIICGNNQNISEILNTHTKEIEKLQHNVSWLALHGGGGAGSGSVNTKTEATIKVNNIPNNSDSNIVLNENEPLVIMFDMDASLTQYWNVSIQSGTKTIQTSRVNVASPRITIEYNQLVKYFDNYRLNIDIVGVYNDEENAISGGCQWHGSIIQNIITLELEDKTFDYFDIDNSLLTFYYQTPIVGEYTLYLTVNKDGDENFKIEKQQAISIINENKTKLDINIGLSLFNGITVIDDKIGVFKINAKIQNNSDSNISKSLLQSFVVQSDSIMILSQTMSTDINNPINISSISFIDIKFVSYYSGALAFNYNIKINNEFIFDTYKPGLFGEYISNQLNIKETYQLDTTLPVEIVVSTGTIETSKIYYINIVKTKAKFLKNKDYVLQSELCSFYASNCSSGQYEFTIGNDKYNYNNKIVKTQFDFKTCNKNNLSVITLDTNGTRYLRLSNNAYGVITNNVNNVSQNSFGDMLNDYCFSINIVFKADYHPDDDRTVLFFGKSSSDGKPMNGISINVHDVYFNSLSIYKLTDNTINDITITHNKTIVTQNGNESIKYVVKLYIDGVLSDVELQDNPFSITDIQDIYIGCLPLRNSNNVKVLNLCDCNIYAFSIYHYELSDFDIFINYINNKLRTNYKNNELDFENLLPSELAKNFCSYNEETGGVNSLLFDTTSDKYTSGQIITATGLNYDNLSKYKDYFKIPIVFLDLSANNTNTEWTFDNFSKSYNNKEEKPTAAINVKFDYYDPATNKFITLSGAQVEIQGTSTLTDFIKNLELYIPDGTIFTPKETWLPESQYTLKADIVDSGHCNNAAVGKFINELLGDASNDNQTWLPYAKSARTNFYNSNYYKKHQSTATLKHTIEGFPILLFAKFCKTSNVSYKIDTIPLGIYSFNLGRGAKFNFGFETINRIIDNNGNEINITGFPYAATDCIVETDGNNTKALWIEADATQTIKGIENLETVFDKDLDTSHGDFWQYDKDIIDELYKINYTGDKQISLASQCGQFKRGIETIARMPIEGNLVCEFNMKSGDSKPEDISPNQRLYHIIKSSIKDETGKEITKNTFIANDGTNGYAKYASTFSQVNDMEDSNIGFDIQSASKYFIIALLFGLKDNFGKNISFRCWGEEPIITDFYDLDCAFQDANQGTMDFTPDSWIKYLFNNIQTGQEYGFLKETFNKSKIYTQDKTNPSKTILNGTQSVVSANHNKLWLSLDSKFAIKKWSTDSNLKSFYTQYWHSLRMLIDNLIGNSKNSKKVHPADWFVDTYFIPQMENCGPLIFNLDYKTKYLAQVEDNYNDYSNSKAMSKLHGRKISIVRNWLKKHIDFLDSLFYLRDTSQAINYYNNVMESCNSTVGSTPVYIPMKSNSPVILKHSLGSNTSSFYFMPENVYTNIAMANQYTNDRSLVWLFTCSNKIIEIGNTNQPLNSIDIGKLNTDNTVNIIDGNGFTSLSEINLSGLSNIESLDMINLFASRDISELRDINLSNINGKSLSISFIDKNGGTKFIKLNSINISDSKNIQSVTLPSVPMSNIDFSNSMIQLLNLKNQQFIKNINITGCSVLQEINLNACDAYEKLNLNSYNELHTVSVTNCEAISSITIDNCNSLTKINIEQCPNLQTIKINNCKNLTGIDGRNVIFVINDCNKLNELNLNYNNKLTHLAIYKCDNIASISLLNTNVYNIKINNTDDITINHVDLSSFSKLSSFSISNNDDVKEIYLQNKLNSPVSINNISGCKSLKRIYGHIKIANNRAFNNCHNFSILGRDIKQYKGYNIKDGNYVHTPWEILMLANGKTANIDMINDSTFSITNVFDNGTTSKKVTNITFSDVTNILYMFCYYTNITLFDVYYALFIYALQIKEKSITKETSMSNSFVTYNIDNDVVSPFFDMSIGSNISRWTFYGCTYINYIYNALYVINGPYTNKYLPSPTYTIDLIFGTIKDIKNDGLYSPLVNAKHFDILGNVFDQYIFIGSDNEGQIKPDYYSKLSTIYFTTTGVVCARKNILYYENNNKTINIGTTDFLNKLKDSTFIKQTYPDLSNITYLFASANQIKIIYYLNLKYLNYNTIKIPKSTNQINISFNSVYGYGELNLNNIYNLDIEHTNDSSKLTILNSSFNVTNENIYNDKDYPDTYNEKNSYVSFVLSDSTFNSINNIIYLGDGWHIDGYQRLNYSSFNGNGIKKELYNSKLPVNIFKNLPKLKVITNLFTYVTAPNMANSEYIELPSNLFKYNTELMSINSLFKDVYFNYHLTPNGFENCHNLTYCAYVFANTKQRSYLQSYIPYRLFYHGQNKITKEFYGVNDSTKPSIDDLNRVETKRFDYYEPISNITTMEGCFMNNLGITHYQNDNIELEDNLNYVPFTYTAFDGKWTYHSDRRRYVHAWSFDGNTNRDDCTYIYKDNPVDNSNIEYTNYNRVTIGKSIKYKTPYFICSPDLFRYCSNTATVSSCFDGCGVLYNDYFYDNSKITFNEGNGISGRIPEYLFEPVNKTTSLAYMFRYCTNISPYKQMVNSDGTLLQDTTIYHIPDKLFNNMNNLISLEQMFRGFIFERYAKMNVFNNIPKNNNINISGIFAGCIWGGKTKNNNANVWNISNLFSSHNTININGAFCNVIVNDTSFETNIDNTNNYTLSNYYNNISFKDIFNPNLNYNNTYNVYKFIQNTSTNVTVSEKNTLLTNINNI